MLVQENLAGINTAALNNTNLKLPTSPTNLAPIPFVVPLGCGVGIAPVNAKNGAVINGLRNGAVKNCAALTAADYIAVRGNFKTPTLRNINFTGPYFHNGSRKTTSEVLQFYLRGGDFNNALFGQKDFDVAIKALGLDPLDQQGILTLLNVGLTDPRVAKERAPFDHPQLCVPHGHDVAGADNLVDIPAIGGAGNATDLQTFSGQLSGGTGVHDFANPCGMSPLPNVP
jgi:hypothetical protein